MPEELIPLEEAAENKPRTALIGGIQRSLIVYSLEIPDIKNIIFISSHRTLIQHIRSI